VLWDADLVSLDVILPPHHPLAARDVTRAYAWLGEAVAAALVGLGAMVAAVPLAEARALQARTDAVSLEAARTCFGGVSPFEVLDADRRKCVGLAQIRRAAGTVFQCGILLGFAPAELAGAVGQSDDDAAALADALDQRVVGLRDLGVRTDAGRVIAAVDASIGERLGVTQSPSTLRPDERTAADRIAAGLELMPGA
jgi:lipoate---protein ligase